MNDAELKIVIAARDQASRVLQNVRREIGFAVKAAAAMGVAAAATGIGIGFQFNSALEQAQVKLEAFTGNNEQVAKTLAFVKEEAAKTQFSFTDMANAAANLTPIAKATGRPLEELIRQAEVLAAINPAEGLTGAVFSLREALTGDWVSIVDRFNLPRTRINQLKAEGVPAMEIISRTLKEMGIDYSLVAKQGQTTAARFDQLKDKFQILAGELTKPLFDRVSRGLDDFSKKAEIFVQSPEFRETLRNVAHLLTDIGNFIITNVLPAMKDLVKFLADHTWVILAVAAAFSAIRVAMFLAGALEAFKAVIAGASATYGGLQTLIATPLVMPAIAVAAAIASIGLVYNEAVKTRDAILAADAEAVRLHESRLDAARKFIPQTRAPYSLETQKRARAALHAFEIPGYATGGSVRTGQSVFVGERQAEVFTPNTQGRIQPNVRDGGSKVTNILSGTFNFTSKESVDEFFKRLDKTQRLQQLGMA